MLNKNPASRIYKISQIKNNAWFSDFDWVIFKNTAVKRDLEQIYSADFVNKYEEKIRQTPSIIFLYPDGIYVIKKTGEFSLAKGFETFVAGPKGQNAFLKQGLLPTKQQERSIEVQIE
jgi:ABC-type molybdate transport system substrate-binding protein